MKVFNLDHLVSIVIVEQQLCKDIEWQPFKKSFWGNTKEGFYERTWQIFYTEEELKTGGYYDANLLIQNKKVYYRPYVKLIFSDGSGYCKQDFNFYYEAALWAEQFRKNLRNHLVIGINGLITINDHR